MAVKYFFEHYDNYETIYRVEISNDEFVGAEIELNGRVSVHNTDVEKASYPIRSLYASINVLASTDRNLSDLFNDEERYWSVRVKRNGNDIFFGYLTSDSSSVPFNTDRWEVKLSALGPMAFLSDLAYVDDNGAQYTDRENLIKILANALKRGFVNDQDEFEILTYCPLGYKTIGSGTVDNGKFLESVSVSQNMWLDESSGGVSDCQTVIFDILDSLGLAIFQIEGNTWIIYDSIFDMTAITQNHVRKYDSDGVFLSVESENKFSKITIKGDHNTDPFTDFIHVEENQNYSYKRTVSSVAVDFKHLLELQFLENSDLDGGVSASQTLPGWTKILNDDNTYSVTIGDDKGFVILNGLRSDGPEGFGKCLESDKRYAQKGEFFTLVANISYSTEAEEEGAYIGTAFEVVLVGNTNTWYLKGDTQTAPTWETAPSRYDIKEYGLVDFSIEIPDLPEDGQLGVNLYPLLYSTLNGVPILYTAIVYFVDLVPTENGETGNTYRGTLTNNKSGEVTKESVSIATAISYSIVNAFFLGIEPIESIYHPYLNKTVDSGEIAVNRHLIEGGRRIYFSGSVLNPISNLNYISIPELSTNLSRILSSSFECNRNLGYYEFIEINESVPVYDYEKGSIYPETIKPTIVG